MKYKVGDILKLKNKRGSWWNSQGKMDKFIGRVVKVRLVDLRSKFFKIELIDEFLDTGWSFREDDVERYATEAEYESSNKSYKSYEDIINQINKHGRKETI